MNPPASPPCSGSTTGSAVSERVFVVFDNRTGRIHQTHRTIRFDGAEGPEHDQDPAAHALQMARGHIAAADRAAADRDNGVADASVEGELEAIEVDPSSIARGGRYRVELSSRALVAVP